jgi:hypothetical protein
MSPVPCGYLLFTVLHVTLVYTNVQYVQGLLSVLAWHIKSFPNSCSSCYNGHLVTGTVIRLTAAKLKPLIFSVSGFTFSNDSNICIFMILYGLCLLPAQYHYVIKYTVLRKSCATRRKSCAMRAPLPMVERTLLFKCCNFERWDY